MTAKLTGHTHRKLIYLVPLLVKITLVKLAGKINLKEISICPKNFWNVIFTDFV